MADWTLLEAVNRAFFSEMARDRDLVLLREKHRR